MFKGTTPLRFVFILLSFLFMGLPAYAQPATAIPGILNNDQSDFDLNQANKQFYQLGLKLSVEDVNLDHLDEAITLVNRLMVGANAGIKATQKKLDSLNTMLDEASHAKDSNKNGADLRYLTLEQKRVAALLAQYRLFSIRAQEALTAYQNTVDKLRKKQIFTKGLPLWTIIKQLHQSPLPTLTTNHFTVNLLSPLTLPLIVTTMIISMILTTLIIVITKRHPKTGKLLSARSISVMSGILLFLCFFCSAITLYLAITLPDNPSTDSLFLLHIAEYIVGYVWAVALVVLFFNLKGIVAIFSWYTLDYHFFKSLLIFLLSYYALSMIGQGFVDTMTMNNILWQLSQIIFLSLVLITTGGFFYYFCQKHQHIHFIHAHRKLLFSGITLLFLTCAVINILGYHTLGIHLTYASITSFALLFTAILIERAIQKLYFLCTHPSKLHEKIMHVFGYKSDQTFIEFLILKITLQVFVILTTIYWIGQNWDYGTSILDTMYLQVINGFHFATFTFYPTRIIAGIIVFCVLYLLFRSISNALSKQAQFEDEEETQVAVASILTYVGFACALVSALFISGIDFTGLAIVAGALSVGIGLGLQSIVNNFVSGLILLIEKPIKPGDRISIDGIEGTVKKIRVRSTQMTTTAREDVIIPNSDLITHPVTNYMFSDTYLSIHCEVGVAYGSDTDLVKRTLLEAVHEHDEVIKTARSKPTVIFNAFGESALIFQVWFLIKDGNKKISVRSDINFSIERLFRENNISIAFPQRDINVKLSEIKTKITDI